ncbi:MAG: SGNH/GDSL hydrolase family protein [Planctomycetes bacterium]|nr:SGNH/GDSL hydrolase family protein [Planctomycetota bacterium]
MPFASSAGLRPYGGDDLNRVERLGTAYELDRLWADQSGTQRYAINTLGYRGPEFDPAASRRVFVFGESHAFGQGLPDESTWPRRFAARWAEAAGGDPVAVSVMNFAEPGASNGYITRLLLAQSAAVRPDLVLLHFAESARFEGMVSGRPVRFGTWFQSDCIRRQVENAPANLRALAEEWRNRGLGFLRYRNLLHNAIDTLRNVLLAQFYCRAAGIDAIATCDRWEAVQDAAEQNPDTAGRLLELVDPTFLVDRRIEQMTEAVEAAADGIHLGIACHEAFATVMLDAYRARTRSTSPAAVAAGRPRSGRPLRIFAFGGGDTLGAGLPPERAWVRQVADRIAADHGLPVDAVQVQNFAERGASNQQIARAVLATCAAERPDAVLVGFTDHRRYEGFVRDNAFAIGPWLLEPGGGVRGWLSRLLNLDERVRQARQFYEFAPEGLGVLESLRSILLVQNFCAALGLPAVASCRTIARLRSDEAQRSECLGPLLALLDDGFLADCSLDSFAAEAERPGEPAHARLGERLAYMLRRYWPPTS